MDVPHHTFDVELVSGYLRGNRHQEGGGPNVIGAQVAFHFKVWVPFFGAVIQFGVGPL